MAAGTSRISIHALREEGDPISKGLNVSGAISIHALREEGDRVLHRRDRNGNISIHALREEGDASTQHSSPVKLAFLSTPSARRATQKGGIIWRW